MEANAFDAVVIGSGFGGAVAACRLSQAGLRVLVLERGRRYEENDFPALPPDDQLLPDLRRWTWNSNQGLWDIEDLGEIVSVQAAGYGGGSLIYANVHLRPPRSVFDASWPAALRGRGALDEYFDLAGYMLSASPISERRGKPFVKTRRLETVARNLDREDGFFRPPLAVSYEDTVNDFGESQRACNGCGKCCTGCPRRSKNSLDLNYLAVAERFGARVRTQCEVTRIRQRDDGGRVHQPRWSVRYIDHLSATETQLDVDTVFLCAGTVHSTRLLASAALSRQSRAVRANVGLGYYPNSDALGIVYDTRRAAEPSRGPTITTSTVHWSDATRFFMIQDGGYAAELERLLGILRAPLWVGRNRLSSAPRRCDWFRGRGAANGASRSPLGSPLDGALDAIVGGAFEGTTPAQLLAGRRHVLRAVERPLLVRHIVDSTIDRAWRAALDRWGIGADGALARRVVPLLKLGLEGWLGSSRSLAEHALGAILELADLNRHQLTAKVLGHERGRARQRMMLLAMGRDECAGALIYDRRTRKLTADLDLYRMAPGYTQQESLMTDMARELGGELRVNPTFEFLGKPITVHSQGGCRMSDAPEDGVTQEDGQVHGCPGLYVLDGSVLCQSVGVNPSATILAIAERNVLRFIRRRPDLAHWPDGDAPGAVDYRRHQRGARTWRERSARWAVTPPEPPPGGSSAIESGPLGISFRETMQGYCGLGDDWSPEWDEDDSIHRMREMQGRHAHPLVLRLNARVADLRVFFEDYEHRIELAGTIEVNLPGLAAAPAGRAVRGHLQLFVPRQKPYGLTAAARAAQERIATKYTTRIGPPPAGAERLMRYQLAFEHDQWQLDGYKRIRQDPALDAWRDTSSLFVRIGRRDPAVPGGLRVVAAGVVHVDLTGFLYDQLQSFAVSRGSAAESDPERSAWALGRFGSFFFGTLQRIYVPEVSATLDALFDPNPSRVQRGPGARRQ